MKYRFIKWVLFIYLLTNVSLMGNQVTDSLYVAMLDAHGKKKVDILNELSGSFRDNDNEESHKYAKQAYEIGKRLKYKEGIAESYMNQGIFYSTKGEYEVGRTKFRQARKLFKELKDLQGEARVLINIGIINNFQGNLKEALINLQKSLLLNEKIKDSLGISKSYVNLGILYYNFKDYNSSLTYYLKALSIKKALRDSLGIGLIFNNIGQIYCNQNKHKDALDYYYSAKKILEKHGNKNHEAMIYNNLSQVYVNLKDYNSALKFQILSLKIINFLNDKYDKSLSYLNLGEIYLHLEDRANSKKYLDSALLLSQNICDNIGVGLAFEKLGDFYFFEKDYKNSLFNYYEAINYFQTEKLNKDISHIYYSLSKVYYHTGDLNQAYGLMKLNRDINDSIQHFENDAMIYQTFAKLEVENYIETLKKDNEIKESKNTFLLTAITSISLIVLILTIGFFVIRSKNKKLEDTIFELEDMNRFQKDVYNKLTNDILSTLYPLSINIAKLSRVDEFDALNKSYLGFSSEYEKLLKSFKIHIGN